MHAAANGFGAGEKTREHKDRAQRDAQNREHAGAIYTTPHPGTLPAEDDGAELSGLPWGSINMQVVMSRGYAAAAVASSTGSPSTQTTTSPVMSNTRQAAVTTATAPVSYYLSPFVGGGYGTGGYEYYGSSGEEAWTTAPGEDRAHHAAAVATTPGVDESPYFYDYEYEEGQ